MADDEARGLPQPQMPDPDDKRRSEALCGRQSAVRTLPLRNKDVGSQWRGTRQAQALRPALHVYDFSVIPHFLDISEYGILAFRFFSHADNQ